MKKNTKDMRDNEAWNQLAALANSPHTPSWVKKTISEAIRSEDVVQSSTYLTAIARLMNAYCVDLLS